MPIDIIHPATGAYASAELRNAAELLLGAINQIQKTFNIASHLNNGVDFIALESAFGLQAGQGQIVFDLLNGTLGALNGTMQNSNAIALTSRVA
jgi:hypothetical protein